jgi:signal transduction histidine kinase
LSASLRIPVGISSSLLQDEQGQHQGIVCICRDISLTKEVNRLKELDNMKSEFVSTVSHELKNPIAIIKSSVETIQAARKLGKDLGADFEDNTLNVINEEINRLSQLINDLLSLSRLESGRVEIKKEPTDIQVLIDMVVRLFAIHETTHPIAVTIDNPIGKILLDPDKIKQVLVNYVGNAIKYSPHGSPVLIDVKVNKDLLKVTVSDHGVGIPGDKIKLVFNKFTRIVTKETQFISGTGLGLSISQKIMELHHGKVWCESVYQKGSTFGFSIPISAYST